MQATKTTGEAMDAAAYWRIKEEIKRMEEEIEPHAERLKSLIGKRQAGNFEVNVSESTTKRVDTAACRDILGDATPMAEQISVRLLVKYCPANLEQVK